MNGGQSDSPEVIKFMTLFSQLKDWCDDDPDQLVEFARADPSIAEICSNLFAAEMVLEEEQDSGDTHFAAPVNPSYISSWREYQNRYKYPVFLSATVHDWPNFLNIMLETSNSKDIVSFFKRVNNSENNFRVINDDCEKDSSSFKATIHLIREFWVENPPQQGELNWSETLKNSVKLWYELENSGFDLHGVLRRKRSMPFFLIPRSLSNRHANSSRISLLENLRQAQTAFIYGAPHAALALMRSILEATLRDHYRIEGSSLEELIRFGRGHFPEGVGAKQLHELRKIGNAVVHIDNDSENSALQTDEEEFEMTILSSFNVLRLLIEGSR